MNGNENGLRVFKDQSEANFYLIPYIRDKRPREARLIQYSGQAVHDLLMELLGAGCKVQLLVQDPRTANSQFQFDKIWSHISDLLGPALADAQRSLLELRKYNVPGSIRAMKIGPDLLCVGWYTYYPMTDENESGLKGHDNAQVCINADSPQGVRLDAMFSRSFDWLWHGGAPWSVPIRKQDRLPWNGAPNTTAVPPDFAKLILSPGVADFFLSRWQEIERCLRSKAHLSAIIMMGSLLEGILLDVIHQRPNEAKQSHRAPRDNRGTVKSVDLWPLGAMIAVAHDLRWIGKDVNVFSTALCEFRNLIHANRQIAGKTCADEHTVRICWEVVQAAINDLANTMGTST